ncbi:MAG: glycosyltransferase [Bacteriovoracaceae bacterium]|jgi:glycosyltransferase involved in cell wall biosynthesis|nr:glycosyltransferase [Bacteriovoracaceae bacterium]
MKRSNIFVISHALVVPENRKRWEELASLTNKYKIILLIPEYWESTWFGDKKTWSTQNYQSEALEIVAVKTTHPSDWSRYRIEGLPALLKKYQPLVTFAMIEEYSHGLHWTLLNTKLYSRKTKIGFFSWQNLKIPNDTITKKVRWYLLNGLSDFFLAGTNKIAELFYAKGYTKKIYTQTEIGVDPKIFYPDLKKRDLVREKLKLDKDCYTIGFVGRIVSLKGVFDLLAAVKLLPTDLDTKLVIVGDGDERSAFGDKVRELDLVDKVIITGHIDQSEVPDYMRAFDVMVLPSRSTEDWTEQFGLVIPQAQLCGIPVIGADSGAIVEVVGDDRFIFPEGDEVALSKLLIDRENLKKQDTKKALRYSVKQIAADTLQIIEEVLK